MAENSAGGASLFRQKSLDRVASPEQTDDYVRLPSPGAWLLAAAAVVLAAGFTVFLAGI